MQERALVAILPTRGPSELLQAGTRATRTVAAAGTQLPSGAASFHKTATPARPTAVPASKPRLDTVDATSDSTTARIAASFQRAKDLMKHGSAAATFARQAVRQSSPTTDEPSEGSDGTVFVWTPESSKFSGKASEWKDAVAEAESVVHPKGGSVINPRNLLGSDLSIITSQIRRLLGSGHPVLNTVSSYYFQQQGKHVRPLIVLLMSMATSVTPKANVVEGVPFIALDEATIDRPLAGIRQVLFPPADPNAISATSSPLLKTTSDPNQFVLPHILPTQRRLAEITEMIHTASLLHDDVIDESPTRRSQPSANAAFGNKMAILAGDFLLARASVALARLRDVEVVELLATVISNLVEGEFMQLRNSQAADAEGRVLSRFEYYLEKTYLKTASLIAKSCRAAAVLGGCEAEVVEQAYEYGRSVGLAFQVGCFSLALMLRRFGVTMCSIFFSIVNRSWTTCWTLFQALKHWANLAAPTSTLDLLRLRCYTLPKNTLN